jgi:hypothetical protein
VAFAGAGKSALTGFLAGCARRRRRKKAAKNPASVQLFLKLDALAIDPTGKPSMALGTKKREARKSMHQPGWITLDGGFAARPCVVQDLSSSGAKVTIDDPNTLPAKLRLAFSRDARTGRNCEVVWRRGRTVGIKFVR